MGYIALSEDIVVKTRPLKDVFNEEGLTHIDYMSIDVEGHELSVLKGIDFHLLTTPNARKIFVYT